VAVVELQVRTPAFSALFASIVNRMRLPVPTIDFFAWPELQGKPLQSIECRGVTVEPTDGAGQATVQADLVVHFNDSYPEVRAAGSLAEPADHEFRRTIAFTLAVVFVPPPGGGPARPQLQWSVPFGVLPPGTIPVSLPGGLDVRVGAVESDGGILAIRLGTAPGDPVTAPIVDRLGGRDWAQVVPGELFADGLRDSLAGVLTGGALPDDVVVDKAAAGAWVPAGLPGAPMAIASAGVTARDACLFDIDVDVDLFMAMTLQPAGSQLTTTVRFSWDADATWCQIVGGLLFTPIASAVIGVVAEDQLADAITGAAGAVPNLTEIGSGDDSITFRGTAPLATPSAAFRLEESVVEPVGLVVRGRVVVQRPRLGLTGEVDVPVSQLDLNCKRGSVTVGWHPAQVWLRDIGAAGGSAPTLFAGRVAFDPPNAWTVQPAPADVTELRLTFLDPPGGRLPPGTPTSVTLATDCGVRWVDLGVIPVEHAPPTEQERDFLLALCVKPPQYRWTEFEIINWLLDPPYPGEDPRARFDPLRLHHVGLRDLVGEAVVQFVAVGPDGERVLGSVAGPGTTAVTVVTSAREQLALRTSGMPRDAAAPVLSQQWLTPLAATSLDAAPVTLTAAGGRVGFTDRAGAVQLVELDGDGALSLLADGASARLTATLGRRRSLRRPAWSSLARVDASTVAVVDGDRLVVGRVGRLQRF
jgi:hypothetical protein